MLKDFVIQSNSAASSSSPSKANSKTSPRSGLTGANATQLTKLEGMVKVNNFLKKKELKAREEC